MAVCNSNLNVLPFYPNKKYWHSNRWYTYGQMCPVMMKSSETLPFQLVVGKGVTVNDASIKRVSDDVSVRNITTIVVNADEDNDIVMAKSQTIQALELGSYYYHIHFSDGTILVSDIVAIIDDKTQYIKIEYWNDDNLYFTGGRIDYSNEFRFVMYVKSTIGKPDYEFQEEITERLGYKFIDSQISNKVFNFSFPANEALCDAMRLIRMSDYIKISSELDSYNALYFSYEAEWEDKGDIATVKASFETDTIIQKLESFNRRQTADFYNALLSNIEEPILFDVDTIAQYYREYKSNVEGKLIRELDDAVSLNDAALIPVDLGDGPAKKINFKQAVNTEIKEYLPEESLDNLIQLSKLFGIDTDGNVYVVGGRTFYTEGGLSAKGLSTQGGGGGTSGATSLGQLVNVGTWADEVPSYDRVMVQLSGATNWTEKKLSEIVGLDETALGNYLTTNNYAKKTDIPSLDGYATQSWVISKGYATTADLETKADKTITINAGTGLTGGGNLSTNRTISLATVGTAGTYTKVTVDAYGRVTGNSSLVAADIPTLAISKINGLQSALDSKLNASVFNDLFEKVELSDGTYAIRAKYGLCTDSFLSAKGYSEEGGSSGSSSYLSDLLDVSLTELATDDMLKWDGDKWVNIPMSSIAGASSWDEITGKPSWIGDTKPSYTFAEITSKPTTLSGYGITDAVTIGTEQTITAIKNHTKPISFKLGNTDDGIRFINKDTGGNGTGLYLLNSSGAKIAGIGFMTDSVDLYSYSFIGWGSQPWKDSSNFSVSNSKLQYKTYPILHTGNYSATLDKRYVTLNTEQAITGNKDFKGSLTKDGKNVILYEGLIGANALKKPGFAYTYTTETASGGGATYGGVLYAGTENQYGFQLNGSYNSYDLYFRYNNNGTFGSWTKILLASNYSTTLDTRYVKKAGDTMTGLLTVPSLVVSGSTATVSGNKVWHAGNDGSGSGLNADLLDGYHVGSLVHLGTANSFDNQAGFLIIRVSTSEGTPSKYGSIFQWGSRSDVTPSVSSTDNWYNQLYGSTSNRLYFRTRTNGGSSWTAWNTLAYTTDNVASATKLQTPRTIWGQPFDGTANVSGSLTGVTSITASGTISSYSLKSYYIRIECDNNGNFARTHEINDYNSSLYLQQATTNNLICCGGGGNVGIGTTSPTNKLHVAGTMGVTGTLTAANGILTNYTANTWLSMATRTDLIYSSTNQSTNGAHALYRVKNSNGDAIVFGGLGVNVGFYGFKASTISAGTNGQNWNTIWNVETGALYHSKNVEVVGTIYSKTGIYTNGYMTAKTTSDIRLKTILNKVDYQQKLLDLGSVVNFKYNDIALKRNKGAVDEKEHIGLIYQNAVRSNLVNFCHKDIDGFGSINYIASDYINLIAGACQLNILGLRTLSKRTETLEQRVARLEKENIKLKLKLNAYEKSNSMVS